MIHRIHLELIVLTLWMLLSPLPAFADHPDKTPGRLSLTLDQTAKLAIENSHTLASQIEAAAAAKESAGAAGTKRFPQVSLRGDLQFMSKIGIVQLPTGQNMQIGDHRAWAVGPLLDWTAWDAGVIAKNAKSMRLTADAKKLSAESERRTVLLNARLAYFGVQLALEQLKLIANALTVARSQLNDVSIRHNAGAASLLDLTAARQETADREKDYLDANQELAMQARNLVALLDLEQAPNASYPADEKLVKTFKSPPIEPDLILDIDPISATLTAMRPRAEGAVDIDRHPAVESAKTATDAGIMAYESAKAKHWPAITVQGRSTYEYPNFSQLSNVQQNKLSLGLNLPLIDWGMISKQARSERYEANSTREEWREVKNQFEKALGQTKDSIALFTRAKESCANASRDASETARLTYDEYIAGHVIFLEVQRANNVALAAKVDEARNDARLLGQLAQMENLITESGDGQ